MAEINFGQALPSLLDASAHHIARIFLLHLDFDT